MSVFPVGLVGKFGLSSPVILRGTVHTFYDSYDSGRTFKVDMAGFAVNIRTLKQVNRILGSDKLQVSTEKEP